MFEAWHFLHPTDRQYSFYSHVHQTYSRIDYFFMDKTLLPNLWQCTYESIVISDHSPLVLELEFPQRPPMCYQWRLKPILLPDKEFVNLISSEITLFLEANSTPGMSCSTIWESQSIPTWPNYFLLSQPKQSSLSATWGPERVHSHIG